MKIAVTSQNFRTVTNHAGRARRFLVFLVEENKQPVEVERIDLPKEMSIHSLSGHLVPHPLDHVDVLLSASFGPGFARNMTSRNIVASLTEESDPILAIKDYLAHGQRLPGASGCGEDDHHHHHDHEHGDDCGHGH